MNVGIERGREVLVLSQADLAAFTAALIGETIEKAVAQRGRCRLVLAGGRTPAAVYRLLATRTSVPWQQVHAYIGDERCVPPDHADSNYRMIAETLLGAVSIPDAQVHRLRGEHGAARAAEAYHVLLDALPPPKFDLVLSGVGADGHTASLFPGDPRVSTETQWAMPAAAPPRFAVRERVGLSLRALNATRVQLVLCTGRDKDAVRRRILDDADDAAALPAALLRGIERTVWIVDPDTDTR